MVIPIENDANEDIPDSYALQSQLALPYMPTPQFIIDHVIAFLQKYFSRIVQQQMRVVDLGSGDGRVVHVLAESFPLWDIRGVEINRELCEFGQKLVKGLPNAHIVWGDLFQEDLTGVNVVFLYALPDIMSNLRHLFRLLPNHALIISFRYPFKIAEFSIKEIFHESIHAGNHAFQFFVYQREAQQ